MIHMDKPYYVTGETVYYKMYFPKELSNIKPIVEIQIYDDKGDLVNSSYLKKERERHINGYYKIPFDLESGVYTWVASVLVEATKEMVTIGRSRLAIYNDSGPVSSTISYTTSEESADRHPTDLKVSMSLSKQQIRSRDFVDLIVDVQDVQGNPVAGNMSLSVTDIGLIGKGNTYPYSTISEGQISLQAATYLSEYIPVFGKLDNGREDQLMTFFVPSSNQIYYTTSKDDGNFQLLIPGFFGDRSVQYIGAFSDSLKMELDKRKSFEASEKIVYPESVNAYLEESQSRKIIYQLFNKVEGGHSHETPKMEETAAPDRSFNASEYPFETIPAFCKELSTPLKFVKAKKGKAEFRMFNPESRTFYFGSPLFIVDGQMTKDIDYLSTLDFQKIDQINLYYDNQRLSNNFGFAGFSGVVIITSKDQSLKVPITPSTQSFKVSGLQPNIVNNQQVSSEEPIFKPQLLWEPALDTDSNGHLELSYLQSDDISQFKIEIVVQSPDGRRGYGKLEYSTGPGL